MKYCALKTKIPEHLRGLMPISFCVYRKYCPYFHEVDPFLLLCEAVVDGEGDQSFWSFTVEDVAKYVSEKWNHPNLTETFTENNIDGKALVLLEADKFPKVNIKNFEIIKELTAEIKKLCKIDDEDPHRGISLPPRKPGVLFLLYKAHRTGPKSYYMTPSKYFRLIHIIRDETTEDRRYYALLNHWNRIPPFRPWCPHVTIGGKRRINPMTGTTQRQYLPPKLKSCWSYALYRQYQVGISNT